MKGRLGNWLRWALIAALGCGLMAALGQWQVARALELDDDGVIAADEVIDDDVIISSARVIVDGVVNGNLIASAGFVTVNGRVNGDLLVFGGEKIEINGLVNGNIALAGRMAQLNGAVRGSVFMVGMELELGPAAVVGRNAFFTGLSLVMKPGATVGQDVWVNAYQALLAGEVGRDVQADVSAMEIGGRVGRNVLTKVAAPDEEMMFVWPGMPPLAPAGLRIASSAAIEGALAYASPVEQAEAIRSQPREGVTYEPVEPSTSTPTVEVRLQSVFLGWVRELITLLLLGGLIIWRRPGLLEQLADQAQRRWLPSMGWGLLIWIAGYIVVPVCLGLVFIVGLMLAIVTFGDLSLLTFGLGFSGLGVGVVLFWSLLSFGSKLVVASLTGRLLLRRLRPEAAEHAWGSLALGVFIYTTLHAVPVLGGLIWLLATLLGVGAVWLFYRRRRAEQTPAASGLPPASCPI